MPRRLAPRAPLVTPLVAPLVALLGAAAAGAQPAPKDSTPPPIEDNSFLVEEAYNQERGVVQHISTFSRLTTGRAWAYTFTQEWPVTTQTHQLSYTVPIVRGEAPGASPKLGDLALNYRWQARDADGVLFAPRLTALLPTGDRATGAGFGGVGAQVNLPLTLELAPRWVTHSNLGGTLIPRGETRDGERQRLANLTLGQSVIFLARPTLNLMLEGVYSRTSLRVGDVDLGTDDAVTLSPGVRFAINVPSGLQIVPGIAIPVTMRGSLGAIDADTGVFLYLSFEHPFGRR